MLILGFFAVSVLAQFPSTPSDLTIIKSRVDPKVTISFKETSICERNPGVQTYSGYVNLPKSVLADVGSYDINSYFMYFEARNNPSNAPLAIYLAGGPGESSIYAAMSSENGPCYINVNGTDSINNPWSFNNNVNMLYIDQPVQSGYSYDKLVNATFDLSQYSGLITPKNFALGAFPKTNASFGYGTFPSQQFENTVNNTVQASKALWHFVEHWLSSFPGYNTRSPKLSIWGNSYGGYWVPESAVQFSKQLKSLPSQHPLKSKGISIDAVGITNGCVDIQSAIAGYPQFAYNNTYGVRFGSEAVYNQAMQDLNKPGGCRDVIGQCRALGQMSDPDFNGANATVNGLCVGAFFQCFSDVINPFPGLSTQSAFDVAIPSPSPCDFYLPVSWYLNTASTQRALGVPLNFTYNSNVVASNFGIPSPYMDRLFTAATGDPARQNGLPNIEYLLANNVKVAFIFGDRDYRCPWTGGEATALAAKWSHQADFSNAGYEQVQGVTTPVDQGGLRAVVKQYAQFSFTRVLDAGHTVSAYAPETVYRIFDRTTNGLDVATGCKSAVAGCGYHTTGPKDSLGWRNRLPQNLPQTCMVQGQFQKTNPWKAVTG